MGASSLLLFLFLATLLALLRLVLSKLLAERVKDFLFIDTLWHLDIIDVGALSQDLRQSLETSVADVVVLEVVLAELLVLLHGKVQSVKHWVVVIELVVSDGNLLERLSDGHSAQESDNTLVH